MLYVTLLIPEATSFESLVLCLAPGLMLLGLVIANPSTNLIGLIVATQIPGLIGMSHDFKPNLLLIVNASLSTLTGIAAAVLVTAVIRNKRPAWTAKRALRKGIRELLQFITAVELNSASLLMRQQFVARTLDKVNVILPRKRIDSDVELAAGGNLITEAWLGANCYDFYARHQAQLAEQGLSSDRFFGELRIFLKNRIRLLPTQPHEALLEELNRLILALEALAQRDSGFYAPLFHLFNVRLSLYPQARWPLITSLQA